MRAGDATTQATWTSSAGLVASLTPGTVTGVAQATATVSPTYTVEGTPYTAGTAVTVTEPVLPLALAGNATNAFGGSATDLYGQPPGGFTARRRRCRSSNRGRGQPGIECGAW